MSDPNPVRGRSAKPRRSSWYAAVIAILLIAVLWFTVFAPDPVMVKVVAIERGTVESTVTNSKAGTLRSRMRSHMSAETGGRVTHIYFREGSSVKRGDLLIKLNDTSSQARIELSQAAIATSIEQRKEACLNRDYAKRDVDRTRELARNNVTSVEALDRLEVAYQAAEAGCSGARAQVEYSYWAGPDLVIETHSDRSAVVTASIAAGGIVRFAPAIVAAAAAIGLAAQEGRVMGEIDEGLTSFVARVLRPGGPVPLPQQVAALYVLNAWAGHESADAVLVPAGSER